MYIKDILTPSLKTQKLEEPVEERKVIPGTDESLDESISQYEVKKWDSYILRFKSPTAEERMLLNGFKECRNFVLNEISVRRKIFIPPYPTRGQKGLLLAREAISLFPRKIQEQFNNFSVELILFFLEDLNHEWVITLPREDFKIIKKTKKNKNIQQSKDLF